MSPGPGYFTALLRSICISDQRRAAKINMYTKVVGAAGAGGTHRNVGPVREQFVLNQRRLTLAISSLMHRPINAHSHRPLATVVVFELLCVICRKSPIVIFQHLYCPY